MLVNVILGLSVIFLFVTGKLRAAGIPVMAAGDKHAFLFTTIDLINYKPEMIHAILKDRPTKLFIGFTAFFAVMP